MTHARQLAPPAVARCAGNPYRVSGQPGSSFRFCRAKLPARGAPGRRAVQTDVTAPAPHPSLRPAELLDRCSQACRELKKQVARVVVGQDDVVDLMLVTLLARGHALLVGVPGLAKTLLVSSVANVLGLSFGRVQFTPDLLPADITGTDVLNEVEVAGAVRREVRFMAGPIFKNLVLADEINRTPPKTQAALLQAMQERCVTVGGATHPLPDPFQVFATRNPIEQEGTYPLPEAQLDRFLLEIHVEYPSEAEEREIARRTTSGLRPELQQVIDLADLRAFGELVPKIPVTDEGIHLAVQCARLSRPDSSDAPEEIRRYVRFGAGASRQPGARSGSQSAGRGSGRSRSRRRRHQRAAIARTAASPRARLSGRGGRRDGSRRDRCDPSRGSHQPRALMFTVLGSGGAPAKYSSPEVGAQLLGHDFVVACSAGSCTPL